MPRQLCDEHNTRQRLGGIGRTTYFELIASGELASVKIGRRRLVISDSIDRYIERLSAAGEVAHGNDRPAA
ncbi:MAG: helix-turn-helix domain-containing protein [Mycobacteriales bacterium]